MNKKVSYEEEVGICSRYFDEMLVASERLWSKLNIHTQWMSMSEVRAVLVSGLIYSAYMQLRESSISVRQIDGIHQTLINYGEGKLSGFNERLKQHALFINRVEKDGTINTLVSKVGNKADAYRIATAFCFGEMLSSNGGIGVFLAENKELQQELVSACASLRKFLEEVYGGAKCGSGCLSAIMILIIIGGVLGALS